MVKNISAFKDAGVHLQKWIAQKEKMMAVLGPISTEKEMNQNQVEQVKVSIQLWTAPILESKCKNLHCQNNSHSEYLIITSIILFDD